MGIRKQLFWLHCLKDLTRKYGVHQTVRYLAVLDQSRKESVRAIESGYQRLNYSDLMTARKSEKVFIFGSGYSLNDISASDWRRISEHDTIGFNAFVYQKWINVGFHLIRGWGEGASVKADLKYLTEDFKSLIINNPFYKETIYVYQDDLSAHFAHALFQYSALPKGAKVYPYRTNYERGLPCKEIGRGLMHDVGTICDAIHFAFCLGWKEIVLVGVDLYDTRYFWLKSDETFAVDYETGKRSIGATSDRGQSYNQEHSTIRNGIVDTIGKWNGHFQAHGVQMSVYNPKSLLNQVLPIYNGSLST